MEFAQNERSQLSFEVGGMPPDTAIIRVSGGIVADRELDKGDEVHIQFVGMDGEVIANAYGRVTTVAFKDNVDKETGEVVSTDRVHSIKAS